MGLDFELLTCEQPPPKAQYPQFKTDSAIHVSAKNIYQKTTHSTITFSMLFETSHFNSLLQVTP